jgi:hypothetical protein
MKGLLSRSIRKCGLVGSIVLLQGGMLFAHPSPNSAVSLDFHRTGVAAELTLPLAELEIGFKQPLADHPAEAFTKNESALKDYIHAHVNPKTTDGHAWTVEVESLKLQTNQLPFDLVAQVWMRPPAGVSPRKFTFNYSIITHEVMSHWVLIYVRNDWDTAVFSNKPEPIGSIHYLDKALEIDRARGKWRRGFYSVFLLGINHIAEGTDHLLFLLALLLPAPLLAGNKRWRDFGGFKRGSVQLLKIVSAFTVGHSLTLLAGGVGFVRLPEPPIEVLIAISILISAIHAIRPWFAGREVFVAAGFGLIHGLAFASSLSGFNFSTASMLSTVLGFNLGIETMQLGVVAATVPWLMLLSQTPIYSSVRVAGALFAGSAALGWISQRAFHWPNPVEPIVNSVAAHPFWCVAILATGAVLAALQHAIETAPVMNEAEPKSPVAHEFLHTR